MRTVLVFASIVALASLTSAAPVPAVPALDAAARKQLEAEALTYASQTLSVATQVAAGYLRPVARIDLLDTAVRGLFDTARQPLPSGLLVDLRKQATDEAMIDFLLKTRMRLGVCAPVADHRALLASCRAMLRNLDPHSDVVTEEDRKNQPWGDQPAGLGLDLEDNVGVGPQRVLRVLPGTPAQRAGIRPGDEITHLDGKPLRGMTTAQAAGLIKGKASLLTRVGFNIDLTDPDLPSAPPPPTSVGLARAGRAPWKTSLEFQDNRPECVFGVARRDDNSWEWLLDRERRIAHVRIETLSRGTATDLAEVLTQLDADGLGGLILDLRWSAGGFLDEARGVAGVFLGDGVVATVRGRGREEEKYQNTQPKRFRKVPMVVLVNGQTSGGSELIVAALQDSGRAVVAGQRTLGKATVQTQLYVDIPEATVKLTSGEFVRPSGKNLHRRPDSGPRDDWGIRPDRELEHPLSPALTRQLRKEWELQTLRPGGDNKILTLDDPSADPQRQLAWRYLQDRLKK